jgi:transposase
MEQRQIDPKIAGIDVGKLQLDAAVYGLEDEIAVDNTESGLSELVAWLMSREVGRVGMEATGGYERPARKALEAEGRMDIPRGIVSGCGLAERLQGRKP